MWRSKKLIVGVVLAVVLLVGSIGGVVLAADNGDDNQPEARYESLLDRVYEIYQEKLGVTIDQEVLKDAFAQARGELCSEALQDGRMMDPEAMQEHLQNLYDEGKVTREQADELQEWLKARPDIPAGFGFKGHGGFHGMGGHRGFGETCALAE
jgi:hypothetical protein